MISVIITSYNSEEFIERSIKSVLYQSGKKYINEILLIDDGSTDKTINIAKKISEEIKIISKKNKGPASSRNLGVLKSKSELVAFLDADDYWHKDKILNQFEDYSKFSNFDIFVCNTRSVSKNKILNTRFDEKKIFSDNNMKIGEVKNYINPKGRYSFHPPSSIMVKKKVFHEIGYYDENYISVEDSEIFLRWVINEKKILFNSKPLVFYEISNDNSLTKNLNLWSINHFNYWKRVNISKLNKNKKYLFKLMRRNTLLNSVLTIIKRGENKLAFSLMIKNFYLLVSIKYFFIFILCLLPLYLFKKKK